MNFERIRHRRTKDITGQIGDIVVGDGCWKCVADNC